MKNAESQRLLNEVRKTQTAFWDALRRLERELGGELDSTTDYNEVELKDIV